MSPGARMAAAAEATEREGAVKSKFPNHHKSSSVNEQWWCVKKLQAVTGKRSMCKDNGTHGNCVGSFSSVTTHSLFS